MSGQGTDAEGDAGRGASGGGDPGELLATVEALTVHQLEQTRLRLRSMLSGQPSGAYPYERDRARALLDSGAYTLTVHDLERTVERWKDLVPEDAGARARLFEALAGSYALDADAIPTIRRALDLDGAAVSASYAERFGAPLESAFADHVPPDRRPFWFKVPDFLRPDVLQLLQSELEWVQLPWGETLFRQGDVSDGLYIVVGGRLRITIRDEHDDLGDVPVEEVARGDIFGEISILTGSPRAGTAYAIRDSELVRLSREGYDRILLNFPRAAQQFFGQMVGQMRVRITTRDRELVHPIGTMAIIPVRGARQLGPFVEQLSEALGGHGSTLVLSSDRLASLVAGVGVAAPAGTTPEQQLSFWLAAQEATTRFVVLVADPSNSAWTQRCIRTADRILLVAEADGDPSVSDLEREIYTPEFTTTDPTVELILLHDRRTERPTGTARWLGARDVDRHHHVRVGERADFERLARSLAGKAIGVALSAGGARGWSHIGTLRALEEAGILIDAVAGASFGAIIASYYG